MKNIFGLLSQEVVADAAIYTSPNTLTPEEAARKATALRGKVRKGQSVMYVTPEGQTFRMSVKNISGTNVVLFSPAVGLALVDLIQFKANQDGGSAWLVYGQPVVPTNGFTQRPNGEAATMIVEAAEDLKVLKDEKVQNALKGMYKQYVSENDFSRFPTLLSAVDNAFFEVRGNVPMELEAPQQDDEFDEEDDHSTMTNYGLPDQRDDANPEPEEDMAIEDFDKEVRANFAFVDFDQDTSRRIHASLSRHLVAKANTTLAHPEVKALRNHAIKQGFKPYRNPAPTLAGKSHLISLRKEMKGKHAMIGIYQDKNDGSYTLTIQHTRRGSEPGELIRPWKHTFTDPTEMREQGMSAITKYS